MLHHFRKVGAPIKQTNAPWPNEQLQAAVNRGCHQSANLHAPFLYDELSDMIDKGQWLVLPYNLAKTLPNLRLSPIGVVPQHERRPRTIVDYTFSGVNQTTVPLAFPESMQFGRALDRILRLVAEADPRHGPVYLNKVDISDGFYNIWLNEADIPNLGVVMPPSPDGDPLIAFPLALPMGWVNSPPLFCAATETVADLTNWSAYQPTAPLEPNPMEEFAEAAATYDAPSPYQAPGYRRPPVQHTDIYVDDFIQAMQGSKSQLRAYRRRLFHTIHQVFRPLEPTDPDARVDPISLKKLLKGDAAWSTTKTILGWALDTQAGTIHLPQRRRDRLQEILHSIGPTQRRISVKKWHTVLGELRSMELAIPGLKGLFSTMQEALRHQTLARVALGQPQHAFLDDIRYLASDLDQRPTHVQELVASSPSILGACDAAKPGMGGVLFSPHSSPILWRAPFHQDIQGSVISSNHPAGTITNSDLELAGTIAQHDIAAQHLPVHHRTIGTATDNTPTLSWQRKGSTTTLGPAAYLLRCQALHQRFYHYKKLLGHIPGVLNRMADDASRRWDLSDLDLLTHFTLRYPQDKPWTLHQLRPEMLSALTSSLRKQRPAPESFLLPHSKETEVGISGAPTVNSSAWIPPSPTWMKIPKSTSSWSTPIASELVNKAAVASPSALVPWIPSYVMWARRSPFWGPQIPGLTTSAR